MKNKKALFIIFITIFIDLLGFGILIPILPTFASSQIGISDFGIGVLVAIYSLIQFLFNPIVGKLSDRIGRRPVILISLLLTSASYIIFSFSTTFLLIFLSRVLAGLGGSNIGTAQAYIADITDKENRARGMGMIGAAFGLGFVFGPIMGGFLAHYGYEYVGYASASFSFLAFLFAFFMLPESVKQKKSMSGFSVKIFNFVDIKNIIKIPNIRVFIFLFFVIIFSIANIYGTFALLGHKYYGFTNRENGYLFGIIGIVSAIIQGGLMRRISKSLSEKSMLYLGMLFLMIGLGLLPYGINFTGVAIVSSIYAIGAGILQPTIISLVSKYSPEEQQGAVLGFNSSMGSLARVLGPLWGGFAFEFLGYGAPFVTGAIFTFLILLVTIYLIKTQKLNIT
ncbi:MAG: tetracycline resistance MFS efflux pump [Ignavibacteriales bacterium CG18_big_fil_WC_8_21_14_2_50_31_20]|nr:MAG: tetracycline resistance MFS efflux pump [Ignavibacteriales bacterium CG18_big_fil_WC_8_21_14_2_50_31_20]